MKAEKEVLFLERIASSVSHELRNTLAVVKENAGLMEDLLMMNDLSKLERFPGIIKTITNQIKQGEETTSLLNRFAHLNDKETEVFDCFLCLEELLRLIKKPLRQKELNVSLQEFHGYEIEMSRFYFQMIIYFIIIEITKYSNYGDFLEISFEKKDNSYNFYFKSQCIKDNIMSPLNEDLKIHLELIKANILIKDDSICFLINPS